MKVTFWRPHYMSHGKAKPIGTSPFCRSPHTPHIHNLFSIIRNPSIRKILCTVKPWWSACPSSFLSKEWYRSSPYREVVIDDLIDDLPFIKAHHPSKLRVGMLLPLAEISFLEFSTTKPLGWSCSMVPFQPGKTRRRTNSNSNHRKYWMIFDQKASRSWNYSVPDDPSATRDSKSMKILCKQ